MRLRRLATASAAALLLAFGGTAAAAPADATTPPGSTSTGTTTATVQAPTLTPATPDPTTSDSTTSDSTTTGPATTGPTECSTSYFHGDSRLGPQSLPTAGEVAAIVSGYNRLAGLTPTQFLDTYWDPAANTWRYPPDNGFVIVNGTPVEHAATLQPGRLIDRFGSEYGAFLAPTGTPYSRRSIPPSSLDTGDPAYTCNYHDYLVLRPFQVEEGPIAPAFGQPGLGEQYQLTSKLLPNGATANVQWLVANGYLERLN